MATIIKTYFGWQAQVVRRVNGKPFREAKAFRTKREAQVWARETEVDIVKGTVRRQIIWYMRAISLLEALAHP